MNAQRFEDIVIVVVLAFAVFVVPPAFENWAEQLQAAAEPKSCQCDGRDDCEQWTFQMHDGRTASCANYGLRQNCCAIPAVASND